MQHAAAVAAPKPNAEDEARGLSVIRARKVEFEAEQFYKALGDNDIELTRAFLDAGMSPRDPFTFSNKETPLTVVFSRTACSVDVRPTSKDTVTLVQLLVARGADASIADEHGNTPLMQAASSGCDGVVMNALLKAGAKLNAVNQAGLTAFEFGLFRDTMARRVDRSGLSLASRESEALSRRVQVQSQVRRARQEGRAVAGSVSFRRIYAAPKSRSGDFGSRSISQRPSSSNATISVGL
jgi:hypothetical protein